MIYFTKIAWRPSKFSVNPSIEKIIDAATKRRSSDYILTNRNKRKYLKLDPKSPERKALVEENRALKRKTRAQEAKIYSRLRKRGKGLWHQNYTRNNDMSKFFDWQKSQQNPNQTGYLR